MTLLRITESASNPLVTCAPLCLTTVTDRNLPTTMLETCPSAQDGAMCSLIAATNIESISTHTMWSCNTDGVTSTDPCSPLWTGITCSGSSIVNIDLGSVSVTGISMLFNN